MRSDETSGGDSEIIPSNEQEPPIPMPLRPFRWPIGEVGHKPAHIYGGEKYLSVECPTIESHCWGLEYGLWMREGTLDLFISGLAFSDIFASPDEWLINKDWHSSMIPIEHLYSVVKDSTFYPENHDFDWPEFDFLNATFGKYAEFCSDWYSVLGDEIDMEQARKVLPVITIPGINIPFFCLDHADHLLSLMRQDPLTQARFEARCYDKTIYYSSAILETR